MIAIALAFATAVGWGASDFFGGQSSARHGVFSALALSELLGTALVIPALLAGGTPHWSPRLLLAGAAGVAVTVELGVIYYALSAGAAFITAPIGALGAVLAVCAGVIGGDALNPGIATGLGLAILGGGLSAVGGGGAHGRLGVGRSIASCLLAAVSIAGTQVALHAAGAVDPAWAICIEHLTTAVCAGAVALTMTVRGRRAGERTRGRRVGCGRLWPLALTAATGTGADLAFAVAAAAHGPLSTVSAISSLYPIPTILLAATVQGRRPQRRQLAGIVLALAGAALLGALAG